MIKNFFKTNNIEYLEEVSLKKYNTYHIDTICAYLAFPKNKEELIIILKELTKNNIKHFILGNGSNIILSMDYYNGVIITCYMVACYSWNCCYCDWNYVAIMLKRLLY